MFATASVEGDTVDVAKPVTLLLDLAAADGKPQPICNGGVTDMGVQDWLRSLPQLCTTVCADSAWLDTVRNMPAQHRWLSPRSINLVVLQENGMRLPSDVATELLAGLTEAEVPVSLPAGVRFGGARAAGVARSSRKKALLIIAGCEDASIQMEYIDLYFERKDVLETVLNKPGFLAPAVLEKIHERLWTEPYAQQGAYATHRQLAVRVLPLAAAVRWAETALDDQYAYGVLGERLALNWDTDESGADVLKNLCRALRDGKVGDCVGTLCAGFGRALTEYESGHIVAMLQDARESVDAQWFDEMVAAAYSGAREITLPLLDLMLERLARLGRPQDTRAQQAAKGDYSQYTPSDLRNVQGRYTREAYLRMAATYPGALHPVVSGRMAAPEGMAAAEVVDAALATNHLILAHALLSNTGNGEFSYELDHSRFLRALDVYETGVWPAGPAAWRPKIDARGAVNNIPSAASIDDVCRLASNVNSGEEYIVRLYGTNADKPPKYTPSTSDLAALLAMHDPGVRMSTFLRLLRIWTTDDNTASQTRWIPYRRDDGGGGEAPPLVGAALFAHLEVAAESVAARDIFNHSEPGRDFVFQIFWREFGEDDEAWMNAITLIEHAGTSLSKIVRAARALC